MITVNEVQITADQLEAELARHGAEPNPRLAAGQELVLRELLRQRALHLELDHLEADELAEAVLAHDVRCPEADLASCQRYYDSHPEEFREGDLLELWHILFQLVPGVDPQKLRARANEILIDLHRQGVEHFESYARSWSNCPSGAEKGGYLGELGRGETVPEFEKAVFLLPEQALATELIESRYGFHIVRTGRRAEGRAIPFAQAHADLARWLEQSSRQRAIHQYLRQLVDSAQISGIPMAV